MRDHLASLLSDLSDSAMLNCRNSKEYQECQSCYEQAFANFGAAMSGEQWKLYLEYEALINKVHDTESKFSYEAIFLQGVDVGLMLAANKEAMK